MSKLARTKEAAEARYAYGIALEKGGKTEAEVAAILGYATTWGWQYLKQRQEQSEEELVGFRVLSLLNMKADDMLAMLDLMEEARL